MPVRLRFSRLLGCSTHPANLYRQLAMGAGWQWQGELFVSSSTAYQDPPVLGDPCPPSPRRHAALDALPWILRRVRPCCERCDGAGRCIVTARSLHRSSSSACIASLAPLNQLWLPRPRADMAAPVVPGREVVAAHEAKHALKRQHGRQPLRRPTLPCRPRRRSPAGGSHQRRLTEKRCLRRPKKWPWLPLQAWLPKT